MLSEMTPEQFDEYAAMDRIIPYGDEKICWVLANGFAAMVNRLDIILKQWCGVNDLPKTTPSSFIPWKKKKSNKKPEYVNPNQAAAIFSMAVNR
jgi:hypothetical protein